MTLRCIKLHGLSTVCEWSLDIALACWVGYLIVSASWLPICRTEEDWDPQTEGLDAIVVKRYIPTIFIFLTLDAIDTKELGYQSSKSQTGMWLDRPRAVPGEKRPHNSNPQNGNRNGGGNNPSGAGGSRNGNNNNRRSNGGRNSNNNNNKGEGSASGNKQGQQNKTPNKNKNGGQQGNGASSSKSMKIDVPQQQ